MPEEVLEPMMDLDPRTGNWRPIVTAPRDGTEIWIMDPDAGAFIMRWNAHQKNGLFPGLVGMWAASDGSCTWQEADGFGPTWWKPFGH
ncbi:hypothetical protein SB2_11960 [Methylobacterium radiotolerans]|nr:hypothetical protein SB3_11155 [Methylobacterium radiotolerans]KTS48005.1 hypothetical protein SB2_11960 [Methylobacterium radiotolerans]